MNDVRLLDVVEAVLGVDARSLADDASPQSIPQWDSVTHLQLMLAIEAEFDVQFAPEDMAKLVTLGAIRERVRSLGGS